eukprot:11607178-Heterocapsa_arctica.AAC.1
MQGPVYEGPPPNLEDLPELPRLRPRVLTREVKGHAALHAYLVDEGRPRPGTESPQKKPKHYDG